MNCNVLYREILQALRLPDENERPAVATALLHHLFHITATQRARAIEVEVSEQDRQRLDHILLRLNTGEPLQYVIGEAFFYGRSFAVRAGVLIPRPETELLIDEVKRIWTRRAPRIIDFCTGSGCLAITLALELQQPQVQATDSQPAALEVAAENAARHRSNVTFHRHDLLTDPWRQAVDIMVCNPPYIEPAEARSMHKSVLDYEPHAALFAPAHDPVAFYRALANLATRHLSPGGLVVAEINPRFAREVQTLLQAIPKADVATLPDLDGKPRLVRAVIG